MTIQVTYIAKWQIKNKPWYKWTTCKKLINCKTGREIKKTLKGAKAGYYIERDFVSLSELKDKVELIKQPICQF